MAVEKALVHTKGEDFYRLLVLKKGEDIVDLTDYTAEMGFLVHDGRTQSQVATLTVGDGIAIDSGAGTISLTLSRTKFNTFPSFARGDYFLDVENPAGFRTRLMRGPFVVVFP